MRKQFVILFIVIASSIAVVALAFTVLESVKSGQKREEFKSEQNTKLPQIKSSVPDVEILSAELKGGGTPQVTAIIEIRNNSDKPITSLVIESGDSVDSYGTNINNFRDGDESPSAVLEPHSSFKVDFPIQELRPDLTDLPIRIAGVMYSDNTKQGEAAALGTIQRQKEHYKNKKETEVLP